LKLLTTFDFPKKLNIPIDRRIIHGKLLYYQHVLTCIKKVFII
jgi:hypothetical protein